MKRTKWIITVGKKKFGKDQKEKIIKYRRTRQQNQNQAVASHTTVDVGEI